jgi:hypothetical protein
MNIPLIILEAHPTKDYKPEFVEKFFHNSGYHILQNILGNGCVEYFLLDKKVF